MESLNNSELLNFAIENGMIDLDTIREKIEMNERKKYLEMHSPKIWKSTDGNWYTFVPDYSKKSERRLVKRSTEEKLEDFLVGFYKEYQEPQTIKKTYYEWIHRKIKFGEITKQTYDRYEVDFCKYFKGYEDKNMQYVTTDFLDDFILDNIKKYKMKSKAWSNLRTIIRGTFLYAKKKGYTKLNIVEYLQELDLSRKLFNQDRKPLENTIYSEKEIEELIGYIRESDNLNDIAIMFAIYTGMRVGEIVSLKWEDIGENYIHVHRTQIKYKGEDGKKVYEVRDFPKTEAGVRNIVIVPELRKVIKRIRGINPFTEYVFEKKGRCIPEHSVGTRLYYLCDKFGFPRKGVHSIRKYYATKLINAGVEEIIVISQMGHSDFSTTKKYYYKNNQDEKYIINTIVNAIC